MRCDGMQFNKTKIVSLFVIGGCLCMSLGFFMLLFTGGSFGTLWRTDKKFIIKTKAFETKGRMLSKQSPPQTAGLIQGKSSLRL